MKAVHFGAGSIGRGFIGKVLADNQIAVTFADANTKLVALLNQRHGYKVKVVGSQLKVEQVSGVNAVHSGSDELLEQIAQTDLITTAVGPAMLDKIAVSIAAGLERRFTGGNNNAVNIIVCENMVRSTSKLQAALWKSLPEQYHAQLEQHVGFVDSAVDRIVSPIQADVSDPLAVTVEDFSEWIVDQSRFVGEVPVIVGMQPTDTLMAFVERKLFTLNSGHMITANMGKLAGYQTIREAISDPSIREVVRGAMQESGEVLVRRYGFDRQQHGKYIDKILERFANKYLADGVNRVGRQPLRKLGREDRLTKPLLGTLEYGTGNRCLVKGMAATLCYCNQQDRQAQRLQQMIAEQGAASVLEALTGFTPHSDIGKRVIAQYQRFQLRHNRGPCFPEISSNQINYGCTTKYLGRVA